MPNERIRPHASVIDIDNERLKFWRSLGLIRSIRRDILELTGWLEESGEQDIYIEKDGSTVRRPVSSLALERDYSAVFSMPRTDGERRALSKFLRDFEMILSQKSHIDELIREAEAVKPAEQGIDSTLVDKLKADRKWLLRKRGTMYSTFNGLLNSMHFDVSEMSLAEMRYQAAAAKVRIERVWSDMDND